MEKSNKKRLDLLLVSLGLVQSREKACALIMAGLVEVNGKRIDKPGITVNEALPVIIKNDTCPYVGRGGIKLAKAIDHFGIDIKNKVVIDVGASTGGFTDCLLQNNASKVVALDVGYGQLDWKIRNDPRVTVIEKVNARYLTSQIIGIPADGAVIDVSFISLKLVISPVSSVLNENAFIIALIKPQFEVGKSLVGKGGVVKDEKLHLSIVEDISSFFISLGWGVIGVIPSPILGAKGNREFLLYASR